MAIQFRAPELFPLALFFTFEQTTSWSWTLMGREGAWGEPDSKIHGSGEVSLLV